MKSKHGESSGDAGHLYEYYQYHMEVSFVFKSHYSVQHVLDCLSDLLVALYTLYRKGVLILAGQTLPKLRQTEPVAYLVDACHLQNRRPESMSSAVLLTRCRQDVTCGLKAFDLGLVQISDEICSVYLEVVKVGHVIVL